MLSGPRTANGTYWYYTARRLGTINWDYVKALGKQKFKLERNASAAVDMVIRGVIPLAVIGLFTTTAPVVAEEVPVKDLSFKERDVFDLSGFAAVDGGPHSNAVRVFINWCMGREGQKVFANASKHAPIRKDTPNLHPKDVVSPEPVVEKIAIIGEDLEEAMKLFQEGLHASATGATEIRRGNGAKLSAVIKDS